MNNFNKDFCDFNSDIKLTKSKKDKILASREAVREKIRNYFKNTIEENIPKFQSQGSYVINTILNPLKDEEVDIDDGVYLKHLDENNLPKPSEMHELIIDALKGHTQDGCLSKTSCVRVQYKNFYHLDLPIYVIKSDKAFLAQTSTDEWINSDSKEFREWFYSNRKNEQTSRIIRYLKSCRDYLKLDITSIELTILVNNYFVEEQNRDDSSLLKTVLAIYNYLNLNKAVFKPVSPYEDLWEDLSNDEKNKKIEIWKELYEELYTALYNDSEYKCSLILRELFGERFKLREKDDDKVTVTQIKSGAKPWGI